MEKVNYRVTKSGEVIAVFFGKLRNNKYLCLSLYDNMHFEADANYLRECTKKAKGYNISGLNAFLINRGYEPEYKAKIIYK